MGANTSGTNEHFGSFLLGVVKVCIYISRKKKIGWQGGWKERDGGSLREKMGGRLDKGREVKGGKKEGGVFYGFEKTSEPEREKQR